VERGRAVAGIDVEAEVDEEQNGIGAAELGGARNEVAAFDAARWTMSGSVARAAFTAARSPARQSPMNRVSGSTSPVSAPAVASRSAISRFPKRTALS